MCEYKEDIDKMCWSYSRLTSFENCKYEFYLNYIINDNEEYLSEGNFYAEVGSYVHEILAMIFNGELTPDEASQYYVDNFDNNVFYKTSKSTMDKTFETCADYFANVDFGWLNDYEILGVEKKIKFKILGYKFIGYIDLLLRDKKDNKIVILDHKSSSYPFNLDGSLNYRAKTTFPKYKKQMYLYAKAIVDMYNEYPKEFIWNHFKDKKMAKIPFEEKEYLAALDWLIDTIHIIENEKDYNATLNYFYCTNLCSFRNSCEYAKTAAWK